MGSRLCGIAGLHQPRSRGAAIVATTWSCMGRSGGEPGFSWAQVRPGCLPQPHPAALTGFPLSCSVKPFSQTMLSASLTPPASDLPGESCYPRTLLVCSLTLCQNPFTFFASWEQPSSQNPKSQIAEAKGGGRKMSGKAASGVAGSSSSGSALPPSAFLGVSFLST